MLCCRARGDAKDWACGNRESREGPWVVYLGFCKVNFKALANKLVEASTH